MSELNLTLLQAKFLQSVSFVNCEQIGDDIQ